MVIFKLAPALAKGAEEIQPFCARAYANASVPQKIIGQTFNYIQEDGSIDYIEVVKVSRKEAAEMMKNSAGFLGCDWMIHSILTRGEIVDKRIIREEWDREWREKEEREGERNDKRR